MRRDAPWRTEHEEENHGIFELFCYYLINAKALRQQRSAGWALFAFLFFFQAEDGIRDRNVTGVQTCAPPILQTQVEVIMDVCEFTMHRQAQTLPQPATHGKVRAKNRGVPKPELHEREVGANVELACYEGDEDRKSVV